MKKTIEVLAIVAMLGLFCSCGAEENVADTTQMQPELSQMKAISELATMECYYHNVAEYYKKDATGYFLWKKDKNFWISYDGIVTLGIDTSGLGLEVKGENVKITIPEAKVLSSKPDPDSITDDSYYYDKKSAKASADDQTEAYKQAEEEMEKAAASDSALLAQAQQRVQFLLEDYVKNMGEVLGKEYMITWDIKENHVETEAAKSTEQ